MGLEKAHIYFKSYMTVNIKIIVLSKIGNNQIPPKYLRNCLFSEAHCGVEKPEGLHVNRSNFDHPEGHVPCVKMFV